MLQIKHLDGDLDCYLCGRALGDDDFMVTNNGECVCENCTWQLEQDALDTDGF